MASHCANGSSHIQGFGFYQSCSPVSHIDSFRINVSIADIHILTSSILDVSNALRNTNVPIHERFCVGPPHYYMDYFEKYYPNVTLNKYNDPFCLQWNNAIQVIKPSGQQWNKLLIRWLQSWYILKAQLLLPSTKGYSLMELCPILQFILMMF